MTSTWDAWHWKIKNNHVTKEEFAELISILHDYDHENKEIIAHYYRKRRREYIEPPTQIY